MRSLSVALEYVLCISSLIAIRIAYYDVNILHGLMVITDKSMIIIIDKIMRKIWQLIRNAERVVLRLAADMSIDMHLVMKMTFLSNYESPKMRLALKSLPT